MTANNPGIVLHHFDQSPFGEKIRIIFGFKNVDWQSVRVSRILPRPDLMTLTGGYRRAPVMQIGADIFCDTQVMIRELEARYPTPTLFPLGHAGIPYALAMWSDRVFFQNTVNLVFGTNADKISQEFIEDRTQLRGARFDIVAMKAAIPQMLDQFRAHVDWIEAQLSDGRKWLFENMSLTDINAYMNIWYVRSNLADADKMLDRFPRTVSWENRIREIGHGRRTEISSADALAIAEKCLPRTIVQTDPHDPAGRKPGDKVLVTPDDYGKVAVAGEIVSLSAQHIAIRRQSHRTGDLIVHFPRAGFLVSR